MKTSVPARPLCVFLLVIAATVSAPTIIRALYISDDFYSALEWRMIGPFRAGKVNAVAGVPGNSSVYYFGADGGGGWKTTDDGNVLKPIFDDQLIASIGARALAPSNPNIIYLSSVVNGVDYDIACDNVMYQST